MGRRLHPRRLCPDAGHRPPAGHPADRPPRAPGHVAGSPPRPRPGRTGPGRKGHPAPRMAHPSAQRHARRGPRPLPRAGVLPERDRTAQSAGLVRRLGGAGKRAIRRLGLRVLQGAGLERRRHRAELQHQRAVRHVGPRRFHAHVVLRPGLVQAAERRGARRLQGARRQPALHRRNGEHAQRRGALRQAGRRHPKQRIRRGGALP